MNSQAEVTASDQGADATPPDEVQPGTQAVLDMGAALLRLFEIAAPQERFMLRALVRGTVEIWEEEGEGRPPRAGKLSSAETMARESNAWNHFQALHAVVGLFNDAMLEARWLHEKGDYLTLVNSFEFIIEDTSFGTDAVLLPALQTVLLAAEDAVASKLHMIELQERRTEADRRRKAAQHDSEEPARGGTRVLGASRPAAASEQPRKTEPVGTTAE